MDKRKKISKGRQPHYSSQSRSKTPYRKKPRRNVELEKLKREKLAIALEKQKAGKKLNLFEARLILEQPKD